MSTNCFAGFNNMNFSPNDQKEMDWNKAVEQRHVSTSPLLVRVAEINESLEQNGDDLKVGDEIFLREVSMQHVRLCLEENYNNPEKPDNEAIVVPIKAGGKYKACPHFVSTHTFNSVQELLDVYPFMSDLIFPEESFNIEGVEIPSWEVLQIVRMVQDSPLNQLLEVRLVKRNRHVLLPGSLQVKFLQWNDNWSLEDSTALNKLKPRVYSLQELSEFFSSKLQPIKVKIYDEVNCTQQNCSHQHQGTKSPFSKKLFKFKKEKKPVDDNSQLKDDEDFWMMPEVWRSKRLVLDPIYVVQATNPHTSAKMMLPGDLKLKVVKVSKRDTEAVEHTPTPDPHSRFASVLDSPHKPRSSSETATPLDQLNIMSLRSNRERKDAIVAVVTSSLSTGSRQPSSLGFGAWIALHRTRQVRKLLLRSQDSQYFLVSAHYAGEFKRLPLTFDNAGDVPIKQGAVYISRCTAYPMNKQLDSCREGQYIRFQDHSEMEVNQSTISVVHCLVSDTLDGPQVAATFPFNLPGRFEKIDESVTELTTRDLFRKELPVCVNVDKQDPGIGFDPLISKKSFQVKKIVSELTVIVEILKKLEDGVKETGNMIEIPVKRCSLFLRKAPSKEADPVRGIDSYPMRKDFKGLNKLPCVEMLAEIDVCELKDALRSVSTYPMLSMMSKDIETEVSSSQRSSLESNSSPAAKRKQIKPLPPKRTSVKKSKSFDNICDLENVYSNLQPLSSHRSRSCDQLSSIKLIPSTMLPIERKKETNPPPQPPKLKPKLKPKPMIKSSTVQAFRQNLKNPEVNSTESHNGISADTTMSNGTFPKATKKLNLFNKQFTMPQLGCSDLRVQKCDDFEDLNESNGELRPPQLHPKLEKTK